MRSRETWRYTRLQELLDLNIGRTLVCKTEPENPRVVYAVAVMVNSIKVGHVPRKSSAACSLFLHWNGSTFYSTITGKRWCSEDLSQGGLEVPFLNFHSNSKPFLSVHCLLFCSHVEVCHLKEKGTLTHKQKVDLFWSNGAWYLSDPSSRT